MEVSFTKIDNFFTKNEQFELVVSGLTIQTLYEMVLENAARTEQFQEKYLCLLISRNSVAKEKKITQQEVRKDYYFSIPNQTSFNFMAELVNNLSLDKRVQTVANNAIKYPRCRGNTALHGFSKSITWRKYVNSFSCDEVGLRKMMVEQVLKNNPGLVFPDLVYTVNQCKE